MKTDDKAQVEVFKLLRDTDETGVSGAGHVADGVCFPDGTCVVRWRTEHPSTTVHRSIADVTAIHGHGGKTRVVFVEHPFDRGCRNAEQDAMENAPFAGIGGPEQRSSPEVPGYVAEKDRGAWLAGYEHACFRMFGPYWRTCAFGWRAALTLGDTAPERGPR